MMAVAVLELLPEARRLARFQPPPPSPPVLTGHVSSLAPY